MAPNDIASKLGRQPFQPLRVYLSDGSVYEIPESYFAAVSRTELYLGVEPDETGMPQRSVYCDTRHVTRIEPLVRASGTGGNGETAWSDC